MATRAQQLPADNSAGATLTNPSVPSLARGSSGPSLGSVPLLLRPGRGPWTMCISAAKLGCRDGRIVPLVVPAWHTPGISANIAGDGGQGYIAQLTRAGFAPIPHTFLPAVAFGASRAGAEHSTYLERLEGHDIEGRGCVQWVDAWTRPLQLGHIVEMDRDATGKDDFLVAAWTELCNGGKSPSKLQQRIATQPVISRIESEANRATERSRLLIQQLAGHLPREHYTDSVRQILRRQDVEIAGLSNDK